MAEIQPLLRQWLLLRLLGQSQRGWNLQDLAHDSGMSVKTARRDLQLLARVGFPLKETVEKFGRKLWRIERDGLAPALSFSLDEILSLYMARRLFAPLAGTELGRGASTAIAKIRSGLSDRTVKYLDRLAGLFWNTAEGQTDYSSKSEVIEQLLKAVEDCRITLLGYISPRSTEPVTKEVHPYGIVHHRGALYLKAFSSDHREIRTYKLDRIDSVHPSELKFPRPAQFDLAESLAGSFGVFESQGPTITVKILFSASVAHFVKERRWHASQKLTSHRDGTVTAQFRLSSLEEVKSWILGFGGSAKVLEPASLAQQVLDTALAIAQRYSDAGAMHG